MIPSSPSAIERTLSREQVRELDRIAESDFGFDTLILMENAGRGCAELLLRRGIQGRVVICCGKGNNGGDGFVIARHLAIAGIDVQVLLMAAPHEVLGDAARNLMIVQRTSIPVRMIQLPGDTALFQQELATATWIVDALLGTGTVGEIREPYASAIRWINDAGRAVLAVDVPSGLDCDSGLPLGPCVQAQLTATFVASKPGFYLPGARPFLGEVHVVGIGIPPVVIDSISCP